METTAEIHQENPLIKETTVSKDNAIKPSKQPVIPNGMNGDYEMDNDDAASPSDKLDLHDEGESLESNKHVNNDTESIEDKAEHGLEGEEEEDDEGMEIDSEEVKINSIDERDEDNDSVGEVDDNNASAGDNNADNSVIEVSNSSDVKQCEKDEPECMEVDSSQTSDVECLTTNDKKDDDDDDDDNSSHDASELKICEENGSVASSTDVQEISDGGKTTNGNGQPSNDAEYPLMDNDPSSTTSTPKKKNKKLPACNLSNITPRRSSRNVNRKSYLERDMEEGPLVIDNNSDVEEIKPEDPLAEVEHRNTKDKENSKSKSSFSSSMKGMTPNNKNTIVVNDTKRLVEIAAGSKNMKGGKKEPTLVIIDTNSILSGKGGVPLSNTKSSSTTTSSYHTSSGGSLSVMPIGVSQQMYGNTRTTITPVPMPSQLASNKSTTITPVINPVIQQQLQQQMQQHQQQQQQQQQHQHQHQHQHQQQQQQHHHHQQQQQQQVLPTLTDDMYVVEAPSFIVPYVYEKPPLKPLKDFVNKLDKCIKEYSKEEKIKKQEAREKAKAEGKPLEEDSDEDSDDGFEKPDKTESDLDKNKLQTYFDLPLGKFFMSIGMNLVQEFVQTDLLRTQKRKQKSGGTTPETQMAINSLIKNLEYSKENNEPYHFEMKKCEFCNFKTESDLVMQHHLETPHMRNYAYKCNFCPIEVRSPHDILYHMEAEHNIRGRLERGPAFHQCPNCPFEDNQKGKLSRHIIACSKKFRPERNLEPSMDWEPPAKIPRMNRPRNMSPQMSVSALAAAMNAAKGPQPLLPKLLPAPVPGRGRGRPPMQPRYPDMKAMGRSSSGSPGIRQDNMSSAGMMYRQTTSGLLVPTPYQFGNNANQIFQVVGNAGSGIMPGLSSGAGRSSGSVALPIHTVNEAHSRLLSSQNTSVTNAVKNSTAKLLSQPSISITPLPRTAPQPSVPGSGSQIKPGGKSTFVICEICDGYIKDLEQLRNHMQWIHKVKIHPKMIYNRPPLNCQKCQFRFFTDQGLERHLLGSHGLVTSSMQEAANKGKDAGRCPACGKVYQWKLLNHVARDHGMTLKPAHLSYKCTVCTSTFGMYKQFESHVYSAHSVATKRVMDKKSNAPSSPSSRSNDSLLKPLKINDEITIIPQPAKPTNSRSSMGSQSRNK